MTDIIFHTGYDQHHYNNMLQVTGIDFTGDEGMTLQAPAEDADLNVIMKRFGVKDGSRLPRWADPTAIYGDFSNLPDDPTEVAEILRQGELAFNILPAQLRNRFQTGAELYKWLQDPANGEEAVKIGLLQKQRPSDLETMTQRLEKAMVSTNTSSDKGTLVNPPKGEVK